jgi:hypothetical protein
MTYNNKGAQGCSARGIAKRETIEELLELAEELKESICNVDIKPIGEGCESTLPLNIEHNLKVGAFRNGRSTAIS